MDRQGVPEAPGFVHSLNVPVLVFLSRMGISAPSYTLLHQSFIHEKERSFFLQGAFCSNKHTQMSRTRMCLQARCGLQMCMAPHTCTFTERLWHTRALQAHVQVHTCAHTPKSLVHLHVQLYAEFLAPAQEAVSRTSHTASCKRSNCTYEHIWKAPAACHSSLQTSLAGQECSKRAERSYPC